MAEYSIQGSTLTAIADAIRSKTGSTETLFPTQMATVISGLTVGSGYKTSVSTSFNKSSNTVTETSTLEDGTIGVSYITFDESSNPVSVTGGDDSMSIAIAYDESGHATSITIDGTEHPVTWEGFDG